MAASSTPAPTFESISRALKRGESLPVMLFHGEEGYYTDELVKLVESLVAPDDRDFSLTTVYAPQADPKSVVDLCRSLPMMTDRQVVVVKEAQAVRADWLERLAAYAAAPTPSTVLAVCARGAAVKAPKLIKAIKGSGGLVFEAQKVKEWNIPRLLTAYIQSKGLSAEDKATEMLRDFIGADLSRLYNEVDKLTQILGPHARITAEAVERNVGISKEYNNFELIDALAVKDAAKTFRISAYFEANPKGAPLPMTVSAIFGFFSDILVAYYAKDRTDAGLRAELNLRNDFALRRLRAAMRNYNAFQVIEILHAVRVYDTMSKGGASRQDPYRLFHDLLHHILTAAGHLPV